MNISSNTSDRRTCCIYCLFIYFFIIYCLKIVLCKCYIDFKDTYPQTYASYIVFFVIITKHFQYSTEVSIIHPTDIFIQKQAQIMFLNFCRVLLQPIFWAFIQLVLMRYYRVKIPFSCSSYYCRKKHSEKNKWKY